LIAYKAVSQKPFKVEECTVGTGTACGSIYLDQGFETLLRNKFGEAGNRDLDDKRLAELVQHFNNHIKP